MKIILSILFIQGFHSSSAIQDLWSSWILMSSEECSVSCGEGSRTVKLEHYCSGNGCVGNSTSNRVIPCKLNIPCPVHGKWSTWILYHYGHCIGRCVLGIRKIIKWRDCSNPLPQHGGDDCSGIAITSQTVKCLTGRNCFGKWSHWIRNGTLSPCSDLCLQRVSYVRYCIDPYYLDKPPLCRGKATSQGADVCKGYVCGDLINIKKKRVLIAVLFMVSLLVVVLAAVCFDAYRRKSKDKTYFSAYSIENVQRRLSRSKESLQRRFSESKNVLQQRMNQNRDALQQRMNLGRNVLHLRMSVGKSILKKRITEIALQKRTADEKGKSKIRFQDSKLGNIVAKEEETDKQNEHKEQGEISVISEEK